MIHKYFKESKPVEKRIGETGKPLIEELQEKYGGKGKMVLDFSEANKDVLRKRINKIDDAILTFRETRLKVCRQLRELEKGEE